MARTPRGRQSDEVVEVRRTEVEQALLSLSWNRRTRLALSQRHGVDVSTIRRDAARIRRQWTDDETELSPHGKADWLARLRAAMVKASQTGHTVALQRLMALEAQAMGYLEPLRAELDITHRAESLTPIEQARAIVSHYQDARQYLETAGEIPPLLDVTPKEIDHE